MSLADLTQVLSRFSIGFDVGVQASEIFVECTEMDAMFRFKQRRGQTRLASISIGGEMVDLQ